MEKSHSCFLRHLNRSRVKEIFCWFFSPFQIWEMDSSNIEYAPLILNSSEIVITRYGISCPFLWQLVFQPFILDRIGSDKDQYLCSSLYANVEKISISGCAFESKAFKFRFLWCRRPQTRACDRALRINFCVLI